ncbi:MAG: alpha/beta hydrolase [Pseudomonadota bacterium]
MTDTDLFPGFETHRIATGESVLHLRCGGAGPPLLLLHGYPQTHVAWHAVAPRLATRFTLVIPDLPGYGDSVGPPVDAAHLNQAKRTTAATLVELMASLGHAAFHVAAHDRGARVGYRMALDHPDRVRQLASLDTVPTLDIWEAADKAFALDAFHWPLLAQPAPFPETLIAGNPDVFLDQLLSTWAGAPGALDPRAVAEYRRCFRLFSVLQAMSEDYRAGATVDAAHDLADREAGRRVRCPVYVPWGTRYMASSPEPIWRRWADDVRVEAIDCGHFIAEEAPEACAAGLAAFFAEE